MPEADAEQRAGPGPAPDHVEASAGVLWAAGAWGQHDGVVARDVIDRDEVAPHDVHGGTELSQRLGEVPDERVLVVEQQDQISGL